MQIVKEHKGFTAYIAHTPSESREDEKWHTALYTRDMDCTDDGTPIGDGHGATPGEAVYEAFKSASVPTPWGG